MWGKKSKIMFEVIVNEWRKNINLHDCMTNIYDLYNYFHLQTETGNFWGFTSTNRTCLSDCEYQEMDLSNWLFTYTYSIECCETDLCNDAPIMSHLNIVTLSLLLTLSYLLSFWMIKQYCPCWIFSINCYSCCHLMCFIHVLIQKCFSNDAEKCSQSAPVTLTRAGKKKLWVSWRVVLKLFSHLWHIEESINHGKWVNTLGFCGNVVCWSLSWKAAKWWWFEVWNIFLLVWPKTSPALFTRVVMTLRGSCLSAFQASWIFLRVIQCTNANIVKKI